MTEAEVLERVEEIRAMWLDDELAHSSEDQLRADVLGAIADGAENAPALAAAALKTGEIEFCRWCA